MSLLRNSFRRLRGFFRKEKLEAEMAEEMRGHLERRAQANLAAGMSMEEASYAARRQFGGTEQLKEIARDERPGHWVEEGARDFRYGFRQLVKSPGFTAVAVVSLGLGIGANTAIFSLVNEFLLRSLPVRAPEELVLFRHVAGAKGRMQAGQQGYSSNDPETGRSSGTSFSLLTFERFLADHPSLSSVFAYAPFYEGTC